MKISFLLVILTLSFSFAGTAHTHEEQPIREVLSKQATAWNKGDIEGYMLGYWQSDSLQFVGKKGITHGWVNTLNQYRNSYPDTAIMGKLKFDIVSIKMLCKDYALVTGKWSLQRSVGDIQGHFTLIFKKIKGDWFIISDHSS